MQNADFSVLITESEGVALFAVAAAAADELLVEAGFVEDLGPFSKNSSLTWYSSELRRADLDPEVQIRKNTSFS